MSTPAVTIITPTYNHERYIGACVNSVLQQTYAHWEQIVVDDGSTDATQDIVSRYRDSRIRYERQENQGPYELAHTYNRALSLAKGDLIAILEGDDFWPPDKLAMMIPTLDDGGVVLAHGDRADVDAQGRKQQRKTETARRRESVADSVLFNDPVGSAARFMLLEDGRSLIGPCTVVIRKSALEKIGGFQYVPGLPLTDYPTFLELSMLGRFSYCQQTMGYFRRHQNSITTNHSRVIHGAVSNYARGFGQRHAATLGLSGLEWEAIEDSWREGELRSHFSEGRLLLLRGNWPGAREHFRIASKSTKIKVRGASFAGFLFSLAHLNLEQVMRLGGRSDIRPIACTENGQEHV